MAAVHDGMPRVPWLPLAQGDCIVKESELILIDIQGVRQSKRAEHQRTLASGIGRDPNNYIY